MDGLPETCYNALTWKNPWFPRNVRSRGVFAPLVGALVFKTSGGFEQSSQWVRFPYTPVSHNSHASDVFSGVDEADNPSSLRLLPVHESPLKSAAGHPKTPSRTPKSLAMISLPAVPVARLASAAGRSRSSHLVCRP